MKKWMTLCISLMATSVVFAATPKHYRLPTGLPKDKVKAAKNIIDSDFESFKCANKNDEQVIITKKLIDKRGIVKYEFLVPYSPDSMVMGEFKAGSPHKGSKSQKFVDEYSGEIPGFICAQPDTD